MQIWRSSLSGPKQDSQTRDRFLVSLIRCLTRCPSTNQLRTVLEELERVKPAYEAREARLCYSKKNKSFLVNSMIEILVRSPLRTAQSMDYAIAL